MNKTNHLFTFLAIILFACISCDDASIIEQSQAFNSRLVINSEFTPDKGWMVHVSNSHNILQDSPQDVVIDFAQVTIKDLTTQVIINLDYVGNGFYLNDEMLPEANHSYELRVSAEGYDSVIATNTVPGKTEIVNATVEDISENGIQRYEITLEIEDDAERDEYAIFEVYEIDLVATLTEDGANQIEELSTDDEQILSIFPNENVQSEIIWDDKSTLNPYFKFNSDIIERNENGAALIQIKAKFISKELYDYYLTEKYYRASASNSNVTQPSVFSNVKGGLGIFGGYTTHEIQINI